MGWLSFEGFGSVFNGIGVVFSMDRIGLFKCIGLVFHWIGSVFHRIGVVFSMDRIGLFKCIGLVFPDWFFFLVFRRICIGALHKLVTAGARYVTERPAVGDIFLIN